MTFALTLCLLGSLSLLAFAKPRFGMHFTLLMAGMQDPLRKLTPGEPPIFITFCGIVFAAMALRLFLVDRRVSLFRSPILLKWTKTALMLLLVLIALQGMNSLMRFGSVLLTALGFVSYIAPLVAIVAGYVFTQRYGVASVVSFLRFYVVFALAMISTILLERLGVSTRVFGEVGGGIWISTHGGLDAYSGLYRAAEVAAWHAAAAGCIAVLLSTLKGVTASRLLIALGILAFVVALGILTGRRKFIIAIVIFLMTYFGLILFYLQSARGPASALLFSMMCSYIAFITFADFSAPDLYWGTGSYELYVHRTQSVFSDAIHRFEQLGIQPIQWAINRFGLFGIGLGTGTQGANYIGNLSGLGGAAEGGLGRLTVELGIPGLLLSIVVIFGFALSLISAVKNARRVSNRWTCVCCGLTAILVANVAQYTVATQVYGDYFILIFLGFSAGAILGIGMLSITQRARGHARRTREILDLQTTAAVTKSPIRQV